MLYQALDPETGDSVDQPRASGTLFAAYFLSFVDPALSRELFEAVRRNQVRSFAGFGAIREYPSGTPGETGDVDSGPIILGLSSSGTAFALAGSRQNGDPETFTALYRTLYLFGAPQPVGDRDTFLIGGPLGNALFFALLTANRPEEEHS